MKTEESVYLSRDPIKTIGTLFIQVLNHKRAVGALIYISVYSKTVYINILEVFVTIHLRQL